MKDLIILIVFSVVLMACNQPGNENNISEKSLHNIKSPAGDSCAEPYLFTGKQNEVFLSWIEKKGKESKLFFSVLENEKWSDPALIAEGNNWFVNWADYPVIVADGNYLMAHYLQKSGSSTYAYDVKYTTSSDKGITWASSKILHDDGKQAEHGFVSIVPYGGKFFVSWLDGRNAVMEEEEGHEGHHGQMTIRAAILATDGTKENEWELDDKVCDCCQTSVAITSNGPIVVYRDRSDDEIRDMSIMRYVNGQWSAPRTIFPDNWKIKACPVNGPRVDAIENNLAIAWFSIAGDTAEVKVVFSGNGGETFGKPIKIDEGKPIGRVDIVMLDSESAMLSWMEGADIKAVKVYANGRKEKSIMIASSSEKRSSGFPQMTRMKDKIVFAWTDNKEKTIKTAWIKL